MAVGPGAGNDKNTTTTIAMISNTTSVGRRASGASLAEEKMRTSERKSRGSSLRPGRTPSSSRQHHCIVYANGRHPIGIVGGVGHRRTSRDVRLDRPEPVLSNRVGGDLEDLVKDWERVNVIARCWRDTWSVGACSGTGIRSRHDAPMGSAPAPAADTAPPSPVEVLKSRSYVLALVMGAVLGAPVAAVAYLFLKLVAEAQQFLFTQLPTELGFDTEPIWWPIPLLVLSGLLVALTILYLPGTAGHEPAEGFKPSGAVRPIDLPGIIIAAFATLSLGVVLGPEAPLIAIGSGLGVLAIHLIKRERLLRRCW